MKGYNIILKDIMVSEMSYQIIFFSSKIWWASERVYRRFSAIYNYILTPGQPVLG